jgi:ABC-2 type transport system permease protein
VKRARERIPAGWSVIANKEFGDHVLGIRFLLLFLVLGLVGAGAIYTVAGAIRDQATAASGAPGLFRFLFSLSPAATSEVQLPPFVNLMGFLGPLLGITFGFDAISSERSEGTLPRLLSQPVHRDDVINGKFLAGLSTIALILASVVVLISAVGMIRLGLVPSGEDVARLVVWFLLTVIYVGFWLALATLFSVVFRRAATAALVVIAIWLVVTIFGSTIFGLAADIFAPGGADASFQQQLNNLVVEQNLARLTPGQLYSEISQALLDPRVQTVDITGRVQQQLTGASVPTVLPFDQSLLIIWPHIVGLIAMTVVCFAAAYVIFMRQEVRA